MAVLRWWIWAALACATYTAWTPTGWGSIAAQSLIAAAGILSGAALRDTGGLSRFPAVLWAAAGIACWGCVQWLGGLTASGGKTTQEILYWVSLSLVVWTASVAFRSCLEITLALEATAWLAAAAAVLCILQLETSGGKFLWLFETGYTDRIFGPFPYHNNYAHFMELTFPVSLWLAWEQRGRGWWWVTAAILMFASVVASGSRAGSALLAAEALLMLYWQAQRRRLPGRWAAAAVVAGVAAALAVAGVGRFRERLLQDDFLSLRPQITEGALRMAAEKPLSGWGLGTFEAVYPAYATFDPGKRVHRAHNDWLELWATGGVPAVLLLAWALVAAAPRLWRSRWGIGALFVAVHALVDYPLARLAVSGWWLFLMTLAWAWSQSEQRGKVSGGHAERQREAIAGAKLAEEH